jgi:hypothetical protein
MFSNHKNVHKKGIEKHQRKLLRKIRFINAFLAPDEKVLRVVPCVSPTSWLEQLTTGWIYLYLNRALLVVTNKGMLHIPTRPNYDYRQSIARIRYEDCKSLRVHGSGLQLQYMNGRKEKFLHLPRAHRLKLKPFLKTVKTNTGPAHAGRRHLCPRCTAPLTKNMHQCPSCRQPFKDAGTARKLSLLLPGGGYFYTGHPILGLGDLLVELGLLWLLVGELAGMVQGRPGAEIGAAVFGAAFLIEKLITLHHAKRYVGEFIPKGKVQLLQQRQQPQAQAA